VRAESNILRAYTDTQIATRAPASHSHVINDITNLSQSFTDTSNYVRVESNILRTYTNTQIATRVPASHSHVINDINGLSQSFTDTSNYVRVESNILRTYTNTQIATLQTSLNNKENSFTILPVSKGGTSISTILANHLLGSGEAANTLQAITVGNGLSLSGGNLSVSSGLSVWSANNSGIFYNPTIVPVGNTTNVGIGLSNPSFKLHVVGDINFTGTL
jgi:phage regulator Rha-like protein